MAVCICCLDEMYSKEGVERTGQGVRGIIVLEDSYDATVGPLIVSQHRTIEEIEEELDQDLEWSSVHHNQYPPLRA